MASPQQTREPNPQEIVTQMILGKWVSQAIYAAARLGIADVLADGPKTADAVAAATGTHTDATFRLMRALASVGLFTQSEDDHFGLTPTGDLLRADVPGSLKGIAAWVGAPAGWGPWGEILYSLQTGQPSFEHHHKMPVFEYFEKNPDQAELFNNGMTSFSKAVAEAVATAYDFSGIGTLVDIAGGHGALLKRILSVNPSMQGVLFDLPHVVSGASADGLEGRFTTTSGDFFQAVPAGGDGYIMKHIIHDWDDERALTILRNIRKVIAAQGKLLLVECVIPTGATPSPGKIMDLEMLLMPGGKERTEKEYRELFAAAGFALTGVKETPSLVQVVEGRPV